LEKLRAQKYDLVITDYQMPRLSGSGLAEALKSDSYYRKIPILMVTASDQFQTRIQSVSAGFDDIVRKPILVSEFGLRALTLLLQHQAELLQPELTAISSINPETPGPSPSPVLSLSTVE